MTYLGSESVQRDLENSIKYFTAAAEKGELISQFELGKIYADKSNLAYDEIKASKWLNQVAKKGHGGAKKMLGKLKEKGPLGDTEH